MHPFHHRVGFEQKVMSGNSSATVGDTFNNKDAAIAKRKAADIAETPPWN